MEEFNIEHMCRICLKTEEILYSLFRKQQKGLSPYEKLLSKSSLKVEISDTGPNSICSQCLIELDNTVAFIEKCERSNQVLASYVRNVEFKKYVNVKSDLNTELDTDICFPEENDLIRSSEPLKKGDQQSISKVNETIYNDEGKQCRECGSKRKCRHWTPPTNYTCQYCQKVFSRKFNFKLHIKRHLGERDWPCPTCGASLLTQWLAERHCAPRARRLCPEPGCGKSFTTNTNLKTHIRVHSGERPFECNECSKRFTSKNTLNDHIRIHTGVKPYICPVCGKRFTTNKLSGHMLSHSGSRPDRPTTRRLPTHGASVGSGGASGASGASGAGGAGGASGANTRLHACVTCSAQYAHRQSLNKHLRKHHKQIPEEIKMRKPPDTSLLLMTT